MRSEYDTSSLIVVEEVREHRHCGAVDHAPQVDPRCDGMQRRRSPPRELEQKFEGVESGEGYEKTVDVPSSLFCGKECERRGAVWGGHQAKVNCAAKRIAVLVIRFHGALFSTTPLLSAVLSACEKKNKF